MAIRRSLLLVLSLGLWLHSPEQTDFYGLGRSPHFLSFAPALSWVPTSILLVSGASPSDTSDLTQLANELETNVKECRDATSTYLKQLLPIAIGSESTTAMKTHDVGAVIGDLSKVRVTIGKIRKALPSERSLQWKSKVSASLGQIEKTVRETEEILQDNAKRIKQGEYRNINHQQLEGDLTTKRYQLLDDVKAITAVLSEQPDIPPIPPTSNKAIMPWLGIIALLGAGGGWLLHNQRAKEALMPHPAQPRIIPKSSSLPSPPPNSTPNPPHQNLNAPNQQNPSNQPPSNSQSQPTSLPPLITPPPLDPLLLPAISSNSSELSEINFLSMADNGYPIPNWMDTYNQPPDEATFESPVISVGEMNESFTKRKGFSRSSTVTKPIIFEYQATDGKYWIIRSGNIQDNQPFDYLVPKRNTELNIHERPLLKDYFELPEGEPVANSEDDYRVVYPAIAFPLARRQGIEESEQWKLVERGRLELRQQQELNYQRSDPFE